MLNKEAGNRDKKVKAIVIAPDKNFNFVVRQLIKEIERDFFKDKSKLEAFVKTVIAPELGINLNAIDQAMAV